MSEKLPGHTLAEYLKAVVREAKRDGKVTTDEYDILKQLSFDVAEYTMALEAAEQDGTIDPSEKDRLLGLKSKLLDNAREVANADGIVTDEELALLEKIAEVLEKD